MTSLPSPIFLDVKATTAEISGAATVGGALTAGSIVGPVSASSLAVSGNATVTGTLSVAGNLINPAGAFRNLVVNAQGRFDQRNEGIPPGLSTGGFFADQWRYNASNNTVLTLKRTPSIVFLPGFLNSIGGQTTVVTPASTDFFTMIQNIEAQNFVTSQWGTIAAKPYTLSFWAISSGPTGNFGGVVMNGNKTRSYPFTYNITTGNVWQHFSIAIPGDTVPSWDLVDNTIGVILSWSFGAGASKCQAAGAWFNGNSEGGATGQVGNTTTVNQMGIGGIQFEQGPQSAFEYLPVDIDLHRNLRYFEKSYSQGVAPGVVTNLGAMQDFMGPFLSSQSFVRNLGAIFKINKRIQPAMAFYSTITGTVNKYTDVLQGSDGTPGTSIVGDGSFFVQCTNVAPHTGWSLQAHWTADAGL